MELNRLGALLKQYSPAHFRDVCAALSSLSDELEYTKAALSEDLMKAQNRNDFPAAREILDTQEELSERISEIQRLLGEAGLEDIENVEPDTEADGDTDAGTSDGEHIDYSQYDMDDTVAYDIEDTPVTFKRPAAFSYKGKRYQVTKWKTMLVQLCNLLYKENPDIIKEMAVEERAPGRKRVKMSANKADIHSPEKIAGSNIWIETNRSASDIRKSILVLLDRYGISTESVKVYFRRDYAALHADDDNKEEDDNG